MFACSRVRAESRHRLRKRVLNLRIIACSGTRTTAVFARKTSLYLFSAKSTDRSLRLASRSPRNAAGRMRPGQAESTEAYDRPWKRVSTAALSLGAEEEQPTARVPGAGGCKGLILLRPLNAGRRLFPRKATCGWFWYFCHQKYRESRDDVAGVLYLFSAKRYPKTPRRMPLPTLSRLTFETGAYSRVCKQTGPVSCHF